MFVVLHARASFLVVLLITILPQVFYASVFVESGSYSKIFSEYGLRFHGFLSILEQFHVAVFIHATLFVGLDSERRTYRGEIILNEILEEIHGSNLLSEVSVVYITLLGCNDTYFHQKQLSLSRSYGDKVRILLDDSTVSTGSGNDRQFFEFPTLRAMQIYAALAHPDSALLYIHTKGASGAPGSLQSVGNDAWRRYLTYALIWNYRECLHAITKYGYETCGAQTQETPFRHYGGNMFYSTARFFSSSPPLLDWTIVPRHFAEMLLFTGSSTSSNTSSSSRSSTSISTDTSNQTVDGNKYTRHYRHYCLLNIFHHFYTCPTPRFLYQDPSLFRIRTAGGNDDDSSSTGRCAAVLKNIHNTKSFVQDFLNNAEREWVCVAGYHQPILPSVSPPATWAYAVYAGRELVFDPSADDWIQQHVRDDGWFGHRGFAEWLVGEVRPRVVVDIGANEGFSTLVFANAMTKLDSYTDTDAASTDSSIADSTAAAAAAPTTNAAAAPTAACKREIASPWCPNGSSVADDNSSVSSDRDQPPSRPASYSRQILRVNVKTPVGSAAAGAGRGVTSAGGGGGGGGGGSAGGGGGVTSAGGRDSKDAADAVGERFDESVTKRLYQHIDELHFNDIITVIDAEDNAWNDLEGDDVKSMPPSLSSESPHQQQQQQQHQQQYDFIDILHINGALDYESCKSYYRKWLPWVNQSQGTVLFPFAFVSYPTVGVARVFHEINEREFPYKGFFRNSFGMAVATRDAGLFSRIKAAFPGGEFILGSVEQIGRFPLKVVLAVPPSSGAATTTSAAGNAAVVNTSNIAGNTDTVTKATTKRVKITSGDDIQRINQFVFQLYQEDGYKPSSKTITGLATVSWNTLKAYLKQNAASLGNITVPRDQDIWVDYLSGMIATRIRDDLGLEAVEIEKVTNQLADVVISNALLSVL